MKLHYLKIRQKDEIFIITKLSAKELKKCVNFYFRNPYSEQSLKDTLNAEEYVNKLLNSGINVKSDPNGIQRRMNLTKIKNIKESLQGDFAFMPNAVLLAIDYINEDEFYDFWDNQFEKSLIQADPVGTIDFPDTVRFQIVDGQHRLAGILTSDINLEEFDVPIILMLDSTKQVVAKVFCEINGYQTKVNNSVILDMLEEQKENVDDMILDKKLHKACKSFNEDYHSPFYHHIKMLGYGFGSISQSFFVTAMRKFVNSIKIDFNEGTYKNMFVYFQVWQDVFEKYWNVPVYDQNMPIKEFNLYVEKYSRNKTNELKGNQILKTNGIGAIMYLYAKIYNETMNWDELYNFYYDRINKLRDFDWIHSELISKGSGEKTQKALFQYFYDIIKSN